MRLALKIVATLALAITLPSGLPAYADVFVHPVAGDSERASHLQELARALTQEREVDGKFVQEKYLSVLTRPLQSEGSFSASAEGVFEWKIQRPFSVSYRFAEGELLKWTDDGRERVQPSDDPMLYGFFAFFSSMFDLSYQDLQKQFDIYFERQEARWLLGLIPKSDLLQRSIQSIVVELSAKPELKDVNSRDADSSSVEKSSIAKPPSVAIETVTIREPSGDYSHLRFTY